MDIMAIINLSMPAFSKDDNLVSICDDRNEGTVEFNFHDVGSETYHFQDYNPSDEYKLWKYLLPR